MKYGLLILLFAPLLVFAQDLDNLSTEQKILYNFSVQLKGADKSGNIYLSFKEFPFLVKANTNGQVLKTYGKDLVNKSDTTLLHSLSHMAVDTKGSIFFLTKRDTAIYQLKDNKISIFLYLSQLNKILTKNNNHIFYSYSGSYTGLGIDADNNLYLGDRMRSVIWKINKKGIPNILTCSPLQNKSTQPQEESGYRLASFSVSAKGKVFLMAQVPRSTSDSLYNSILKIDEKGRLTTLTKCYQSYWGTYTDGKMPDVRFDLTGNLQIDQEDNLYFASSLTSDIGKTFYHYNGVRRFQNNVIETLAGCNFQGATFNQLSNSPLTFNGNALFRELPAEKKTYENIYEELVNTQYGLFLGGDADNVNFICNRTGELILNANLRNFSPEFPTWQSLGISPAQAKTKIPVLLTVVNTKGKVQCRVVTLLIPKN